MNSKNELDSTISKINWYPGHMAKGMRELKENSSLVDLIVVILDARCPISSYNPDFDNIAPNKPRLFIITKSDLMDKSKKDLVTKQYKDKHLLWLDLRKQNSKIIIEKEINKITYQKQQKDLSKGLIKPRIKIFVVGIPNVGKSTLINLLANKKTLKVANYPGVTKIKNWVAIDNLFLMDTPGILLPKIEDNETGIKLLAINSISNEIFSKMFLATQFLILVYKYYPEIIKRDFSYFEIVNDELSAKKLLEFIALKMMFLNTNRQIDYNRVCVYIISWVKELKNITFD